jgi:cyclophilin family peptidyl-prolyl cis-trans isomerase
MRTLLLSFFLLVLLRAGAQQMPDEAMVYQTAPEKFTAEFKTTQGNFTIDVYRKWSPLAADRLYVLIRSGFYTNNAVFRVQTGYVVQFGICDNPRLNTFWDRRPLKDEPVMVHNGPGTISFARDGANSRTAQLFINLGENVKLDTISAKGVKGYPPVAKIVSGLETTGKFYAGYGYEPANHQDSIMARGNAYLKEKYPLLDYILEARIIEK